MALALKNERLINAHLTNALYRQIMGTSLSLADLEQVEEQVAKSLRAVLSAKQTAKTAKLSQNSQQSQISQNNQNSQSFQNDKNKNGKGRNEFEIEEEDEDNDLTVEDFGLVFAIGETDLIENGSEIEVVDNNVDEYVKLAIDFYLRRSIEKQTEEFISGFLDIIPRGHLSMFTAEELDLLICGVPEIDLDDLAKNIQFNSPYSIQHPLIVRLFKVLKTWKKDDLARLLRFMTGSSQVPAGGFRTYAVNGNSLKITIVRNFHRLPQAHTCSNELELPQYQTEKEMNDKLLFAVRNTSGFGFA